MGEESIKVRMGMIGGGQGAFIGDIHRMAARLDGKIDLVAGAFSRDYENSLATGRSLDIAEDRIYASFDEMFEAEQKLPIDDRIEFVSIVTPNHMHVPAALAALKAGFHVICDKPAAASFSEVQTLASYLANSDLLYGLTHTYLGYPMVWQMKSMVKGGDVGDIRKVHVEYPQGWLTNDLEATGNKQASWRTDPKRSGISGCMGDIGSHAHSMAEFVSGQKITHLACDMAIHVKGRALDDDGAALFRMDGGASGTLMASQVLTGEGNSLSIRISGSKGTLVWQHSDPNNLTFKEADCVRIVTAGTNQNLYPSALERCRTPAGHPEGYIEAFANLYRDFAAAIRAGEKGTAPGVPGIQEGLRGMAFIETMVANQQSAEKWTELSIEALNS